MWRALLKLLDEASKDPHDTHGWTREERALAREAVEWYRARFPPLVAPAQLSATAEFQRGRQRPGAVLARRSTVSGIGIPSRSPSRAQRSGPGSGRGRGAPPRR